MTVDLQRAQYTAYKSCTRRSNGIKETPQKGDQIEILEEKTKQQQKPKVAGGGGSMRQSVHSPAQHSAFSGEQVSFQLSANDC